MKMKRILPLFMAAVLVASGVPIAANASADAASESTDGGIGTGVTVEGGSTDNGVAAGDTTGTGTEGTTDGNTEGTGTTPTDENGTVTDGSTNTTTDQPESEDTEKSEDTSDAAVNNENSSLVVTLGENLSSDQKATMYKYFGVKADDVNTITVTHADEVKYMEGIASAEQIGSNTVSCAYIEPTTSGGIKVKTANLNFVTSQMIASALTTAGMKNCNVVAACPFQVSGTGALTGIMMAYETASGETLDEGKKQAATEELVLTGALSDAIGEEAATEVINEAKTEILDKGLTDADEIGAAVDQIAENHGATLTDDQRSQIISLLQTMSQYDYDLDSIQDTLNNLNEQVSGLAKVWDSFKSFFVGSSDGIISDTDESVLGDDVVTTSTVDESGFKDGLLTRIMNFFGGK
ncbi:MAG: DUF1002 domain-containing protein [Hespellia sp.]|nr:DUF1002 domain-containing protein [Hespellia sp.]